MPDILKYLVQAGGGGVKRLVYVQWPPSTIISLLRTPLFSSPHPLFLFSAPPFSLLRTPYLSYPMAFCSSTHSMRGCPESRRESAPHGRSGVEALRVETGWRCLVALTTALVIATMRVGPSRRVFP